MAVQASIQQKATLSSISIQTRSIIILFAGVVPIEMMQKEQEEEGKTITLDNYDKEKYREMVLDAAEEEPSWGSLALIELFTVISKRKAGNGMRN